MEKVSYLVYGPELLKYPVPWEDRLVKEAKEKKRDQNSGNAKMAPRMWVARGHLCPDSRANGYQVPGNFFRISYDIPLKLTEGINLIHINVNTINTPISQFNKSEPIPRLSFESDSIALMR
ncbi:hypothetical protein Nepgr_008309 [Nepenthes gracilis]|uniref:Uncharacterized protein n=1 Tax=Nepenthes gracilis TaxID=150966 RepID=A0AAD3S8M5_NEPGR|nr:hypothetical protein Nepgr_008309 [Nepenthes gracilis]